MTSGRIAAPSAATLALSGVGVSVRSGAPKPDISTPEKLKEALIAAKAIAYSDPSKGGASGVHFAKVAERLGIADQVKAKSKHPETAGLPGKLLLDGSADLAIAQVPELLEVQGTDLVGPLPGDLQNITTFAGGVVTGAKQPDAAAAFLKFLQTPEAVATIKAKGHGACLRCGEGVVKPTRLTPPSSVTNLPVEFRAEPGAANRERQRNGVEPVPIETAFGPVDRA